MIKVQITKTTKAKKEKRVSTTRFSKRIIIYCLVMTTLLMLADIVLCFLASEQIDPVSIGAFCTVIISELFSSAWIRVTKSKTGKSEQSENIQNNENIQPEQPEPTERGAMK